MKINNLQRNILIYTFFILSVIALAVFPTSHSKYIKEDDRALVYSADIYNLYAGEFDNRITLIPEKSTKTDAYLEYMFRHSDVAKDATKDVYELIVTPSTCEIDLNNVTPISKFNKDTNKFTFNPARDYKGDEYIIVGMTCKIEDMKIDDENLQVKVKIKEQITTNNYTEPSFDYIDLVYNDTLTKYNETVDPVVPSITIPEKKEDGTEEDIYAKFIKWITTYAKSTNYESEIMAYVNAFVTEDNVKDIPFPLLGISSNHDEENLTYTFAITENLVGYARTYTESLHSHPTLMYFTTRDEDTLEFAFDYYLKNYFYKDEEDNYNKVKNYVVNQGGIKEIVINGKAVPGFKFVDELDELLISNNILSYVDFEIHDNWFDISFGTETTMSSNYSAGLSSLNFAISTATRRKLLLDLYDSYTKNNSKAAPNDEDKKSFTDYFAVADTENNYYVLTKISSDVEANPLNAYNRVEFNTYKVPNDFKLGFVNTTDELLDITISYTNRQDIEEAISFLDTYFGTTSTVLIPEPVDGVITVEYQITKNIAR